MSGLYFKDEAEQYAHKAWVTLGLEPPADLHRVAARLGIEVYEEEFVEQIDGAYLLLDGAPPVIVLNNSYIKPIARRRFTLAHEIGHHLLGAKVKYNGRLFHCDTSKKSGGILERACDRFAVLLLMPEDHIRKHYDELSANSENRVAIMSERFGVSYQAMSRRLRELELSTRKYPRSI